MEPTKQDLVDTMRALNAMRERLRSLETRVSPRDLSRPFVRQAGRSVDHAATMISEAIGMMGTSPELSPENQRHGNPADKDAIDPETMRRVVPRWYTKEYEGL